MGLTSILGEYFWGTEEIYIVVEEIENYSNNACEPQHIGIKEEISSKMLTQKVILHEIGHFLDYNGIKFQEFAEEVAHTYKIIDAWGVERDVRDAGNTGRTLCD